MTRRGVSSFCAKGLVATTALALASWAFAQQSSGGGAGSTQAPGTSAAFDKACMDLLQGKTPKDPDAIEALRGACAKLMKTRSENQLRAQQAQAERAKQLEQIRAEQEQLRMQQQQLSKGAKPGKSAAAVQPGESVPSAFSRAGQELVGAAPRTPMGFRRGGQPFQNTVSTNTIGWFTGGIGINAEYMRSFEEKFSWTAGAAYNQAAVSSANVYNLGFLGGADYFIIGRNNAGLRLGPRLDVSFGRQTAGAGVTARLGLTGEVGYNFLASNGITGSGAFGLGGRIAGNSNDQLSSGAGGEFGPYVKLNVGFSW
jgi:hypothetical protein